MALTGPEVVRTWFSEVWDKGRTDAIDEYAAADLISHGLDLPGDASLSTRERFRLLHHTYRSAFPNITITVDRTLVDGDFVAAHCTVRATHTGDGLGFPATGQSVQFTGICIVRCVDGRIAESWDAWNFVPMYLQLGRKLN